MFDRTQRKVDKAEVPRITADEERLLRAFLTRLIEVKYPEAVALRIDPTTIDLATVLIRREGKGGDPYIHISSWTVGPGQHTDDNQKLFDLKAGEFAVTFSAGTEMACLAGGGRTTAALYRIEPSGRLERLESKSLGAWMS